MREDVPFFNKTQKFEHYERDMPLNMQYDLCSMSHIGAISSGRNPQVPPSSGRSVIDIDIEYRSTPRNLLNAIQRLNIETNKLRNQRDGSIDDRASLYKLSKTFMHQLSKVGNGGII